MKGLITSLALLLLAGCKSTRSLDVVSGFEPDRYMGVWYEAARYPHRFEKGMSNVSAAYSFNEDGTVKVLNKGYIDEKQEWEEIEGTAKSKGPKDMGWLNVSFFKPFYASYKIVYLDAAYSKAIVAGPTYSYLWILSRDPALPEEELNELIEEAEKLGFSAGKLIIVDQTRNQS